jgi:hypothetical protein
MSESKSDEFEDSLKELLLEMMRGLEVLRQEVEALTERVEKLESLQNYLKE